MHHYIVNLLRRMTAHCVYFHTIHMITELALSISWLAAKIRSAVLSILINNVIFHITINKKRKPYHISQIRQFCLRIARLRQK